MWNKALIPLAPRGRLFIVSAPAGTGKTTLVRRLVEAFPSIVHVPSVTTRSIREGEVHGIDYFFVTKEEFDRRAAAGEFLEHIELHGNWYATSRREIEERLAEGRQVVLILDTRGALVLKQQLSPVLIFIKPPSQKVLEQRLAGRKSEDEQSLHRRLEWAKKEMADEPQFHYSVVNDRFDDAFDVLVSIVVAESHKNIMR
jgi:guanylate kinase